MDAVEAKLLEALGKAAVAEAIANKALSMVIELTAEIRALRSAPAQQMTLDPFSPLEPESPMKEDSEAPPMKLSPFQVSFAPRRPLQPITKSNEEFEKAVGEEDPSKNQMWDEAIG